MKWMRRKKREQQSNDDVAFSENPESKRNNVVNAIIINW